MIWAILVFVGVPLWLCALGILTVVFRSRRLRSRHGNIPVRVLRPGHTRWTRGNAIWVSDVFAWRGIPAAWAEDLIQAVDVHERAASPAEVKALHRLGEELAVVEISGADGETLTVAAAGTARSALLGSFAIRGATAVGPLPPSAEPTEGGSRPGP